jgi:hypothetical protein
MASTWFTAGYGALNASADWVDKMSELCTLRHKIEYVDRPAVAQEVEGAQATLDADLAAAAVLESEAATLLENADTYALQCKAAWLADANPYAPSTLTAYNAIMALERPWKDTAECDTYGTLEYCTNCRETWNGVEDYLVNIGGEYVHYYRSIGKGAFTPNGLPYVTQDLRGVGLHPCQEIKLYIYGPVSP